MKIQMTIQPIRHVILYNTCYRDARGRFTQRDAGIKNDVTGQPFRYAIPRKIDMLKGT